MDMKKTTEVVVMSGVLALTLAAPLTAQAAATSITATPSAQTAAVTAGAAGSFVVNAFTLNLSANTSMAYDGTTTQVAVKTANNKGMHTFGGSSQGGSVHACETTSVATPSVTTVSNTGNGCQ